MYETVSIIWDSPPPCIGTGTQGGTHRVGSGYTDSETWLYRKNGIGGTVPFDTGRHSSDTYTGWDYQCSPYEYQAEGKVWNSSTGGSDDQYTFYYTRC